MRNKNLKMAPWCPFCGANIDRPQIPEQRRLGEFATGSCQCGAVFMSDPTGFNVGATMVECLVNACGGDWDLAWELLPGDDYLTEQLERYDEVTHQIVESGNLDGRRIKGVLFFVRPQKELQDLSQERQAFLGRGRKAAVGMPVPLEPERNPKRQKQRATKDMVRQSVDRRDIDGLVDLCFDDPRTSRFMLRLLYDPDEEKRWTVAHIMGKVYSRLSTRQPGMVSDVLHRFFESCADSAAANWGSVEAIGEIIAARPDIYGAFTRHLLKFLGDESMRPQVIWALGTIAAQNPELIRALSFYKLFGLLADPDPVVRGYALRLFGRIRAREVLGRVEALAADTTPVRIYEQGEPLDTEIGSLAREAIILITSEDGE